MDISIKVDKDNVGFIVDAQFKHEGTTPEGEKIGRVTVAHPQLQVAWDLLSMYAMRAMHAETEGK